MQQEKTKQNKTTHTHTVHLYTLNSSLVFEINTYANFAGNFLEASFRFHHLEVLMRPLKLTKHSQLCANRATHDLVLCGPTVSFRLVDFIYFKGSEAVPKSSCFSRVAQTKVLLDDAASPVKNPSYRSAATERCALVVGETTALSKGSERRDRSCRRVGPEHDGCEESSRCADPLEGKLHICFMLLSHTCCY